MAVKPTEPVRRAAIVGCGDVFGVHADAIDAIDGIDLVAVCDTDPERLEIAAKARGVAAYRSHCEVLAEARPHVVHIATPHDQHVPLTIDCLEAGVHVLQEKPIAHTIEEGQRLVDAACNARAKVGICFQNRYNVASQEARRIVDSGVLGAIQGAYASVVWSRTVDYYATRPWRGTVARSGGGLLINQAIHTLDLVQWLMGDVIAVGGDVATRKFADTIEVEDTAEALFTHASGAQTCFYATLTAPADRPVEIEIHGDRGALTIRDGLTLTLDDGTVEVIPERHVASTGRAYWGVSHELLIRDFYATLEEPEPFWISPRDAMASLRMLTALYQRTRETGKERT